MAKKTKDSNLSIEERLEQALIPNWDEPYKLPENWCWVKLSTVCSLENGEKSTEKDLVYLDAKTLRGITEPKTRDSGIVVNKDQKVILVDGENSGEVFVVPYRGYMGSTFKIINIAANADEMYIRYFIDQNRERLRNSKVGSAIPHLNKDLFFDLKLPFPTLCEQKRIVSRIETLFVKLDEASEKAQEVVDGFETRKAAILHKAFSGELTAKWREENDVDRGNYAKRRFDEVAIIKSNLVDPAEYQDYPHIAPDNIEKKTGVLLEYHTIAEDGVKSGKHRFYPGQILYSKIRPNLSKVVVIDFDGLCSADMYPIEAIGDAKCLWYFMLSENFLEQASSAGSRSVLPKINQKELSALTVTIPDSLEEQKEIANIIDSLFAKEYQVKETAEAVIEQIATMKKAILARAFRGELGTNDPSEESAVELIKQIIEEKIKIEESTPKRIPTKRKEVSFVAKTILEALKPSEKLTPEKLKVETALEIDDFYDQLKVLIDNGQIREIRIDGESYLEAVK